MDYGIFSTTGCCTNRCECRFLRSRYGEDHFPSSISVREYELCVARSNYRRRNEVVLRNTRQLLGKTRSELRDVDLKTDVYGSEVLFDEHDKPYFHCLVNKNNKDNPVYRDIYPEDVFGVVLGEVTQQACRQTDKRMTTCCFTIPVNTSENTRKLMCSEASKIGLTCVCMIVEPMAAYYALRSAPQSLCDEELVMIVNVDESSFDVSVICHEYLNPQLICYDSLRERILDEMIDLLMDHVMRKYEERNGSPLLDPTDKRYTYKRNRLWNGCKDGLHVLSYNEHVDISLDGIADLVHGDYDDTEIVIIITRHELEHIIRPILSKLDSFWRQTIMKANIKSESIKHVFLTGGGADIPSIYHLFDGYNILHQDYSNAYGCYQYLINQSHR